MALYCIALNVLMCR